MECNSPVGSEPSAASGRFSEVSEWQRSKKSRIGVSPMIFSGTATGTLLAAGGGRSELSKYTKAFCRRWQMSGTATGHASIVIQK